MTHDIARVSDADADAIARVESAASTRWSSQSVGETLSQPATLGWIVRSGGIIVGHLLTAIAGDSAEVLTIAVLPTFRRQGRAAALLAASEAAWSKAGVSEGFLEVRASSEGARLLYRRHGWEEVGVRRGYYADGEDAVLMRWTRPCG